MAHGAGSAPIRAHRHRRTKAGEPFPKSRTARRRVKLHAKFGQLLLDNLFELAAETVEFEVFRVANLGGGFGRGAAASVKLLQAQFGASLRRAVALVEPAQ